MQKLGANDRTHAVVIVIKRGIRHLGPNAVQQPKVTA